MVGAISCECECEGLRVKLYATLDRLADDGSERSLGGLACFLDTLSTRKQPIGQQAKLCRRASAVQPFEDDERSALARKSGDALRRFYDVAPVIRAAARFDASPLTNAAIWFCVSGGCASKASRNSSTAS